MKITLYCLLQASFVIYCHGNGKKPAKFNQTNPSAKFDNPNYVRDRFKDLIIKPEMPMSWKNRFRKPFHPAWMDYCDPYHCNDYHKRACGLNRKNMKFKWFQSACHIILNNQCSTYRGSLKYDVVDPKFCAIYVMYLRSECPVSCEDEYPNPVCGMSKIDKHMAIFVNRCAMQMRNCKYYEEYEEVEMDYCLHFWMKKII